MHPYYENLFVVGTVEDSDMAAFRKHNGCAPEKIVLQFPVRWCLEGMHLATLRIYARHHVLDSAVLTGCVHGLKNEQKRPCILGVELVLQFGGSSDLLQQSLLCVLLGLPVPRIVRIKVF